MTDEELQAAGETATQEVPQVSTGNPVALNRKVDANSLMVTVDQLDTEHFKNVRTHMNPDKIAEYRQSLKDQGQIQNISVIQLDTGKLALFAGYTRTEAFWQNVCDPLIKKWNSDNNLKSTDPNFLKVDDPKHRKMVVNAFPEEFEKEKTKPHNMVRVVVDESVKTEGQARTKSFIENYQRQDLSLADTFDTLDTLINKDGISATNISRTLKKTPSQISQYIKASKLGKTLREVLVTPETGEVINESDLAKLKEDVNVLMNEYDRRLSIAKGEKDYELSLSLSHVREFSQRVVPGVSADWVCPLTRAQILSLLCYLVGADEKKMTLKANAPPMNYGVFMSTMKTCEELTKNKREGKVTEEAATAAVAEGDNSETQVAEGATTGTVDGLAAQQAATEVSTGKSGEVEAAAAEANADAVVAPAPASDAKSSAESDKLAAELVGGDISDDDSEEELTGETNRKTQNAPLQAAKLKDANIILSHVKNFIATAGEPEDVELTPLLGVQAGALQAAQFGLFCLGLDTKAKAMQKSSVEFAESLEAYITALEEHAERSTKKHKAPAFTMERPTPILPEEFQTTGQVEDDDVEDEELALADDPDAPSEDDLQEIEEEGDEEAQG